MSFPKDLIRENKGLGEWCILHAYRGSVAHNMFVPKSDPNSIDDIDTMAICVPPEDYYTGLFQYSSRGTKEIKRDEWDIVIYEAKKAISLLMKGNPNVLSMLWVEENHYIKKTYAGELLVANRHLFAGRHVYRSFIGYAHAQMKKMETYERQGHMGAKRKELIKKFGYDTKNAAHLIRLLRMGIEFLKDGELYVMRHDRDELLKIKRGEWSLTEVKAEADRLFKTCEEVYISSELPVSPDKKQISDLCMEIIETHRRNQ